MKQELIKFWRRIKEFLYVNLEGGMIGLLAGFVLIKIYGDMTLFSFFCGSPESLSKICNILAIQNSSTLLYAFPIITMILGMSIDAIINPKK